MSGYDCDNFNFLFCINDGFKMKYMGNIEIKEMFNVSRILWFKIEVKFFFGQKIEYRRELFYWWWCIVDIEFILVMIGIVLMVVEMELFISYGMEKVSIVFIVLKMIILVIIVILLFCICLNYYMGVKIKMVDVGLKEWYMVIFYWYWFGLVLELFICSIYFILGNIQLFYVLFDGVCWIVSLDVVLFIVMVVCFYLVVKFVVVYSVLLMDIFIYSIGVFSKVKINMLFVFWVVMRNCLGQFLFMVMVLMFVVNIWVMRVCELYYE